MPVRIKCPNIACGIGFEVPEFYAGQKTRCAACQTVVNVPAPALPPDSAAKTQRRTWPIIIAMVCGAAVFAAFALMARQAQRAEEELIRLRGEVQSAHERLAQAEARAAQANAIAEQAKKNAAAAEKRNAEHEAALRAAQHSAESLRGQIEELQDALAEAQRREERLMANLKVVAEESRARDREWKEELRRLQTAVSKSATARLPSPVVPAPAAAAVPLEAKEKTEPPPAALLAAPDIADRHFMPVDELLRRFEQRPYAADEEYKQRWLVLSGEVAQILETPGGRPYLLLIPWDMARGYRGPLRCRCYAASGREKEWERLGIGERVFILGRVGGLFPPNIIYVLDCAVVDLSLIHI